MTGSVIAQGAIFCALIASSDVEQHRMARNILRESLQRTGSTVETAKHLRVSVRWLQLLIRSQPEIVAGIELRKRGRPRTKAPKP